MREWESFEADRARLIDQVGGKLPAVVAEWDDGDHHMRAVLADNGCENDEVGLCDDGKKLYVSIEQHYTDKMGRASWRRWDSYETAMRGLVVEALLARVNWNARHEP